MSEAIANTCLVVLIVAMTIAAIVAIGLMIYGAYKMLTEVQS